MQDAAGKVQGAAQTQYDYAKDTASNLADKAQGHAQDAHGQAKVRAYELYNAHALLAAIWTCHCMSKRPISVCNYTHQRERMPLAE